MVSMTRKTPLRSKTPLKRSGRLRSASPKRQREYNEYAKVKKAYLALHPICEKCKKTKSQDIHHKAGRVGRYLCDYSLFAALCRACHDFCHANGREARKQGWIIDTVHVPQYLAEEPSEVQSPSQSQAHTAE
jgi:hypothetical protein